MASYPSERTLKKLLKLKTNSLKHFDLKNKLEILATKVGIKPAFEGFTGAGSPYKDVHDNISVLIRAAALVGLRYKLTNTPPPFFSRKPDIKSSFLSAWSKSIVSGYASIWLYRDVQLEHLISASIAGDLNEGYVLGYPECCIKWHEENRVLEVESCFQDIEQYLIINPLALQDLRSSSKTEEQMYMRLLHLPIPLTREELWFKTVDRQILETWKRYPLAPHWACSSCLSSKSKETEKLNNQYKEFAMSLDPKFANEVERSVLNWIQQYGMH